VPAAQDRLLPEETNPVRIAAFRILFESGQAVEPSTLVAELGWTLSEVEAETAALEAKGLVRRDQSGSIVGAVGLSVVPSSSEISVLGRDFWVWCARTAVGVLAALGQGGEVRSRSPQSGRELRLGFQGARPQPTEMVIFWPSNEFASSCSSAVDDLCPNINFFEDREAAESWAQANGARGEVLSIDEVIARSVGKWAPLVAATRQPAEVALD
jgi:Alkylmercury lyase